MKPSKFLITAFACFVVFLGACDCGDDDDDDDNSVPADDTSADDATDDTTDDAADDTGDDTADDTTDDTAIVDIDFEDYSLGDLGSPWILEITGDSTATIVDNPTKSGSGKMLQIDGDTDFNNSVKVSYDFTEISDFANWSFDYYFETDAIASVSLENVGGLSSAVDFIIVNGEVLGPTDTCFTLDADTWYHLTVEVDLTADEFTFSVDGTPTACENQSFGYTYDDVIARLSFMDVGNDGGGGILYFDNVLLW